jgi:hypothetical protein
MAPRFAGADTHRCFSYKPPLRSPPIREILGDRVRAAARIAVSDALRTFSVASTRSAVERPIRKMKLKNPRADRRDLPADVSGFQ